MQLLERDAAISALTRALTLGRTSGQLVAVSGEAGIGKSSVLRACAAQTAKQTRWYWGYCEALDAPRPLGPLLDISPEIGGATQTALSRGLARHEVFTAFLSDLAGASEQPVICVEDIHWADQATLDLLQFLSRRLHQTRAVLVMSWRHDEVGPEHAVHRVLSATVPSAVHRIELAPLSLAAIETLTGGMRNAKQVQALTKGNPFFVTELINSAEETVPHSVRDAVLARRGRLSSDARQLLDIVSVVPSRVELSLLVEALGDDIAGLDTCVNSGLLLCDTQTVTFRHELARQAVEGSLSVPRALACHQRILQAMLTRPNREVFLARIVHHAEAAGAVETILSAAPAAARQAAAVGAHKQAVEHYRRALKHAEQQSAETRLSLLEALAYEHYLTGDIESARAARTKALELARRLNDRVAVARNVRWLSRLAWFIGNGTEAVNRADEAIAALEGMPDNPELAMAYSNRSQIAMLREDAVTCLLFGDRAMQLARSLGEPEILSHALNNIGTTRMRTPDERALGEEQLRESLAIGLANDLHEHVARAYTNLGSMTLELRLYDIARQSLAAGLLYCDERDLTSWSQYMLACRARLNAETGLWSSAVDDAASVLDNSGSLTVTRMIALAVIGLVRTRRGDPDAAAALDEGLELARRSGEPQRLVPILLNRAEEAWRTGRRDEVAAGAREVLTLLGTGVREFDRGRARYWLWRTGELRDDERTDASTPFDLTIRGEWRHAAAEWERIGCPYEQAMALSAGDRDDVLKALEIFHALSAAPAVDAARQRLRELGVTQVPRGPRASTLSHPAGLTSRESEVLSLLATGLKNPQIADRLFVSAKTVEHHVSSILGKLGVDTREQAAAHARANGWLP